MVNPWETFVRHFGFGYGTDVVVVVACAGFTTFAVACGHAFVDELPAHQGLYFADHRALTHAERSRDGVGAWPALALLAGAGNQVGVDLELVGV